ncbi:hypothetical protein D3C81_652390 [compost metagenome]
MPEGSGSDEVHRHRRPDDPRAHRGQQRQESHQHPPDQGAGNVQNPEDDPAEGALGHRHQQVAFDRGAHHAVELQLQATLLLLGQRHRRADLAHQLGAVTQEEIQQVEHDGEAHQKIEGALAEAEGLGREELTALHRTLGDLVAQAGQVAHAHALEEILDEGREDVLEAFDVAGQVQLAALDAFVQRSPLLHQQGTDNDYRQDRDHQADKQGQPGGQVAPPAQACQQPALQRSEDDTEDHCPEHRAIERQENPDKGNGHQHQQCQQRLVLHDGFVHVRSLYVLFVSAPASGKSAVDADQ